MKRYFYALATICTVLVMVWLIFTQSIDDKMLPNNTVSFIDGVSEENTVQADFRNAFVKIAQFSGKIDDRVTTFYYPANRDPEPVRDNKTISIPNPLEPPKHGFGVYVGGAYSQAEVDQMGSFGFGGTPAQVNDERVALSDRTIRHYEDTGALLLLVELPDGSAYSVEANGIAGYREDDRAAAWLVAATIRPAE